MTEALLSAQKSTSSRIMNIVIQTEKAKVSGKHDFEGRLRHLEGLWQGFCARDTELAASLETLQERSYFKHDLYGSTEAAYFKAWAWFSDKIAALTLPPTTSLLTAKSSSPFKPKIAVPKFSGLQRDWESFKDRFTSLVISDSSIDPVFKLQLLIDNLEGEAGDKFKNTEVSAQNFQPVWDSLCRRYDNFHLREFSAMTAVADLPSATTESIQHLNLLLTTLTESLSTLRSLKFDETTCASLLICLVETKLPKYPRSLWVDLVNTTHPNAATSLDTFQTFVERRLRNLDQLPPPKSITPVPSSSRTSKVLVTTPNRKSKPQTRPCSVCSELHRLSYCPTFLKWTPAKREEWTREHAVCSNCLGSGHLVTNCPSQARCYLCQQLHHTLLHPSHETTLAAAPIVAVSAIEPSLTCSNPRTSILLSTAVVALESPQGHRVVVRALLDSGAEVCLISEYVCQTLRLSRKTVEERISGSGGTVNSVARSLVSLQLKSVCQPTFCRSFSALVLNQVTQNVPSQTVSSHDWDHVKGLKLADPNFWQVGRIDCILNAQVFGACLLPEVKRDPNSDDVPVAFNSQLGWILIGGTSPAPYEPQIPLSRKTDHFVHYTTSSPVLHEAVKAFWEIEEVPRTIILNPEEEQCYDHFRRTHFRDDSGRFTVRLPFKEVPTLVGTQEIATSCFHRLEKRFKSQSSLHSSYSDFLTEYRDLHHLEPVPVNAFSLPSNYLPHHPVWKNGIKLRVVFNASQVDRCGHSLNQYLHTGPKLQLDIITVLGRWSQLKVAYTCDIVKMFRQFLVAHEDRDWQRIVWRHSRSDPLSSFRLCTVTYGTACAPFLANACLLQLASEESQRFPEAARVIRELRYVDDFFFGGDSIQEANLIRSQLIELLSSAGMGLDRWASNLPGENSPPPSSDIIIDSASEDSVNLLGLRWQPSKDSFQFKTVSPSANLTVTKRSILSDIARLFDPCGWVTPVIITAKIIVQQLWLAGKDWDTPVPDEILDRWQAFKEELPHLETMEIPRWWRTNRNTSYDIHAFCDASLSAYAATIYIVSLQDDGTRHSRLILAKSRVAPVKVLCLPKLELCGALLLSKLLVYCQQHILPNPGKIYCWSDSEITLAWLQGHPSQWKTFVANRVSEITSSLPTATWRHVPSGENPADLGTRGVTPHALIANRLWWEGPSWLTEKELPYSSTQNFVTLLEAIEPKGPMVLCSTYDEDNSWISRISSFDKLVAIFAYCLRWRQKIIKDARPKPSGPLTAEEISTGHVHLIRVVQAQSFPNEVAYFLSLPNRNNPDPFPRNSPLLSLRPFLDDHGILRVGGRLQHSGVPFSEKHPIILSAKSHVATLLARKAHLTTLHGGLNLSHGSISRIYWIVHGRNLVRKVIRNCPRCQRFNHTFQGQLMAPYPAARVQPSRPFSNVGIDCAGPFSVKASPGRGQRTSKGYVVIFICLATKAVHLELASNYSTPAFMAAFRRFVSRRGLCRVIYSDHGTNFQGARGELQQLFQPTSPTHQEISASLARENVDWRFIPPRAPHFGGIWESNIKAFKLHFKKIVGETKLTVEEFNTLLTQIEACLNSRPLCASSTSASDPIALTPAHFLIGAPITSLPEPVTQLDLNLPVGSRWKLIQILRLHFWRRWSREVLSQMQSRPKWQQDRNPLVVNDIVIIKDDLAPPTRWLLGRVVQVHPGPDGKCRVVTLKTATSTLTRSIHRLIRLDAACQSPNQPGELSPSTTD